MQSRLTQTQLFTTLFISALMLLLVACGGAEEPSIDEAVQMTVEAITQQDDASEPTESVPEPTAAPTDIPATDVPTVEPTAVPDEGSAEIEAVDETADVDEAEDIAVDESNEETEAVAEEGDTGQGEPTLLEAGQEMYKGVLVGFTEEGNAYMGDPNAPVRIEEYSDYQCPFCQRFVNGAMVDVKSNQIANGDAFLIFYDFPLTFHPQAPAAANAARCAGEAGAAAYWAMHDKLFETFGQWSVPNPIPQFIDYAEQIGIETEPFTECAETDRYSEQVQADTQDGGRKGVRGTPAFFVNGELLSGAQPYNVFAQAISRAADGESIAEEQPAQVAQGNNDVQEPEPLSLSDNYAYAIGDEDAPVVIMEFTDLQCPFCARHSANTLPPLIEQFVETGRVRYEFRDLPLDQLHPLARQAAIVARCAGEQDSYVEMHKLLFTNQDQWGAAGLDNTQINYANELGLEIPAFEECLTSGKYDEAIEQSVQEALQNSLNSTPYFVVNGFPVVRGAQPIENFEFVIELAENNELVAAIMDAQRQQQQQAQQQQQQQQQQAQQQQQQPVNVGEIPEGDSFVLGSEDAPITIVEYTDYQCPFCSRHFTQTFPQIKQNYIDQGLVRYVFKDFPIESIHPLADEAAVAAHCAGEQNAFLEMHGTLFNNQQAWGSQQDAATVFSGYASNLGLDVTAFDTCFGSGKYDSVIQADLQQGTRFGVRGTPAFFVNGEFVNGAQPFDVFQQVIQSKLDG